MEEIPNLSLFTIQNDESLTDWRVIGYWSPPLIHYRESSEHSNLSRKSSISLLSRRKLKWTYSSPCESQAVVSSVSKKVIWHGTVLFILTSFVIVVVIIVMIVQIFHIQSSNPRDNVSSGWSFMFIQSESKYILKWRSLMLCGT